MKIKIHLADVVVTNMTMKMKVVDAEVMIMNMIMKAVVVGCGEGEALTVDLEDENGNVIPCEIVDGFTYKDNEYALVQNPEDDSIYLFKVVGDEETGELIIPEDEEFEEVTAYYEEIIKARNNSIKESLQMHRLFLN